MKLLFYAFWFQLIRMVELKKHKKKIAAVALTATAITAAATASSIMYSPPAEPVLHDPVEGHSEASYILWTNETHWFGRNSSTDMVDFKGTNCETILNSMLSILVAKTGGNILFKLGSYKANIEIPAVTKHTTIVLEGEAGGEEHSINITAKVASKPTLDYLGANMTKRLNLVIRNLCFKHPGYSGVACLDLYNVDSARLDNVAIMKTDTATPVPGSIGLKLGPRGAGQSARGHPLTRVNTFRFATGVYIDADNIVFTSVNPSLCTEYGFYIHDGANLLWLYSRPCNDPVDPGIDVNTSAFFVNNAQCIAAHFRPTFVACEVEGYWSHNWYKNTSNSHMTLIGSFARSNLSPAPALITNADGRCMVLDHALANNGLDYLIYNDGNDVVALNCLNGIDEFRNASTHLVLNDVVKALRESPTGLTYCPGKILFRDDIAITGTVNLTMIMGLELMGTGHFLGGKAIKIKTNSIPFDLTGSKYLKFTNLRFKILSGYNPPTLFLLARENASELSQGHTFEHCCFDSFQGDASSALVYIYGTERVSFIDCLWRSKKRAVTITAGNIDSLSSPCQTIYSGVTVSDNIIFSACRFLRPANFTPSGETILIDGGKIVDFDPRCVFDAVNNESLYAIKFVFNSGSPHTISIDGYFRQNVITADDQGSQKFIKDVSLRDVYVDVTSGTIIDLNKTNVIARGWIIEGIHTPVTSGPIMEFKYLWSSTIYTHTAHTTEPALHIVTNIKYSDVSMYNSSKFTLSGTLVNTEVIFRGTGGGTRNSGTQSNCVNGTWIKHDLIGTPGPITLTISGSNYINSTCFLLAPTVIGSNSTHFQIGFYYYWNVTAIYPVTTNEQRDIFWRAEV